MIIVTITGTCTRGIGIEKIYIIDCDKVQTTKLDTTLEWHLIRTVTSFFSGMERIDEALVADHDNSTLTNWTDINGLDVNEVAIHAEYIVAAIAPLIVQVGSKDACCEAGVRYMISRGESVEDCSQYLVDAGYAEWFAKIWSDQIATIAGDTLFSEGKP